MAATQLAEHWKHPTFGWGFKTLLVEIVESTGSDYVVHIYSLIFEFFYSVNAKYLNLLSASITHPSLGLLANI